MSSRRASEDGAERRADGRDGRVDAPSTFPVARCAPCGREVLAHVHVDAGEERYACIHCDAGLDPAELRWVEEQELDGIGYAVWAEREHCGRPDCGGGRCGR